MPDHDQRMTFVIPVVHPDGQKVTNYHDVERLLRETIASVLAVNDVDVSVVVVCHKRPDWAQACPPQVTFLDLGGHPGFAANRNDVRVDKGMKYIAGIWWALERIKPDVLMPMDADDFVHQRLASRAIDMLKQHPDRDGTIITEGYHVLISPEAETIALNAAFRVKRFNSSCGSCRVFDAGFIARKISQDVPALDRLTGASDTGSLPQKALDHIVAYGDAAQFDDDGFLMTLGRHVRQDVQFNLIPCDLPLVAKGCGHGNHDGHRGGDVHWHRITRLKSVRRFRREFGLAARESISNKVQPRQVWRGFMASKGIK